MPGGYLGDFWTINSISGHLNKLDRFSDVGNLNLDLFPIHRPSVNFPKKTSKIFLFCYRLEKCRNKNLHIFVDDTLSKGFRIFLKILGLRNVFSEVLGLVRHCIWDVHPPFGLASNTQGPGVRLPLEIVVSCGCFQGAMGLPSSRCCPVLQSILLVFLCKQRSPWWNTSAWKNCVPAFFSSSSLWIGPPAKKKAAEECVPTNVVFCSPHVAYGRDVTFIHDHFRSHRKLGDIWGDFHPAANGSREGSKLQADSGRGIGRKFPPMLPTGVERTWVFPVHPRHHQPRWPVRRPVQSTASKWLFFQGPAIVIVGWKIRRLSSEFAGKIMKIVVLGHRIVYGKSVNWNIA